LQSTRNRAFSFVYGLLVKLADDFENNTSFISNALIILFLKHIINYEKI